MNKVKITFFLLLALMIITLWEISAFFLCKQLQKKGIFYSDHIDLTNFESYLQKRDTILGWTEKVGVDKNSSRINPNFSDPDKHNDCISVYGDSFVWGYEVDEYKAWTHVLSKLLNCRVANYGVGGYGSDQAFIRFKLNINDKAKVVILSHTSENIIRNVTRYRHLLGGDPFAFKPRFIVDNQGDLQLIPMPTLSKDKILKIAKNPNLYLKHDYFTIDGPSGLKKMTFPYTFSLISSLNHFHVQAFLAGIPWYSEFYQEDHPSQASILTEKIMIAFTQLAQQRGKTPLILIVPTCRDLQYFTKHKKWVFHNLLEKLEKDGIKAINPGIMMIDYLNRRDPCSLCKICSGHFNEEGYRILAYSVFDYLKRNNIK